MISKTRALVQTVLHRFYTVHHNKETFENEIVDEVNSGRVRGFAECKRRVTEALDFRIDAIIKTLEVLEKNNKITYVTEDYRSKLDELETFRNYVKGMVVKVDEDQS